MLRDPDGPTFVQVNEALGPALLKGIRDAGLCIPDDVSVMTTGTAPWTQVHSPPLSATETDYYQSGCLAADLILRLAGGEPPVRRVVRARYVRRASVGPAPRRP